MSYRLFKGPLRERAIYEDIERMMNDATGHSGKMGRRQQAQFIHSLMDYIETYLVKGDLQ